MRNSKDSHSTKLEMIQSDLRQGILRKVWKVGDKLPTEAELARKYGCSVGTVNKAVSLLVHNGLIERRQRSGTRVVSNMVDGSGLKLDALAFICPSQQHEGIWRTMKGFQLAAQESQRRMLMLTTGTDYTKEVELLGRLPELDVRGAVIYPALPSFEELVQFAQVLKASPLPLVMVGAEVPGQNIMGVAIDGFHAGHTMTKHLISRGLKRIGFLTNRSWSVSMRDRYQGYKWALTEAGLPEDERLVLRSDSMRLDFDNPLAESVETSNAYLDQVQGLDVQGVVCTSDYMACGLIRVAQQRGLSVPAQLRISGMDDNAGLSEGGVTLTTYHVPFEEMGRQSFSILTGLLELDQSKDNNGQHYVRGELVVRESA